MTCPSNCGIECSGSCYKTCTQICADGCLGNCGMSCQPGCGGACATNCGEICSSDCSGQCKDTCTGCGGTCSGQCTGCSGCGNACSTTCANNCGESCDSACNSTCKGEEQDTNYETIKTLKRKYNQVDINNIATFIKNEVNRRGKTPENVSFGKNKIDDSEVNKIVKNLTSIEYEVSEVSQKEKGLYEWLLSLRDEAIKAYEAEVY